MLTKKIIRKRGLFSFRQCYLLVRSFEDEEGREREEGRGEERGGIIRKKEVKKEGDI